MADVTLAKALKSFDATEANLDKLERLWEDIYSLIPGGIAFGSNPEYEDRCRSFSEILAALPEIDGWKPQSEPQDLDCIAQTRFDVLELGEPEVQISAERSFEEPGAELREYRFRFNQKRRALVRDALVRLIDNVDADIRAIQSQVETLERQETVEAPSWESLKENIDQIDVLLGSSVKRPSRWDDLRRHLYFGHVGDFHDIDKHDCDPPPLKWSALMYGFEPEGGSRCRGRDTIPKRLSRSCAR